MNQVESDATLFVLAHAPTVLTGIGHLEDSSSGAELAQQHGRDIGDTSVVRCFPYNACDCAGGIRKFLAFRVGTADCIVVSAYVR